MKGAARLLLRRCLKCFLLHSQSPRACFDLTSSGYAEGIHRQRSSVVSAHVRPSGWCCMLEETRRESNSHRRQ